MEVARAPRRAATGHDGARCSRAALVMSAAVAEHLSGDWPLQDLGTFPIRGQGEQRVFALKTDTKDHS